MKVSQRLDALLGVGFLLAAAYFFHTDQYGWASTMLLSSVVSLLSAKYMPAKWLLKRMLLARMK